MMCMRAQQGGRKLKSLSSIINISSETRGSLKRRYRQRRREEKEKGQVERVEKKTQRWEEQNRDYENTESTLENGEGHRGVHVNFPHLSLT